MIWLSDPFRHLLPTPWQSVDDAFRVEGEVYREPAGANRRTLRFELSGQGYFLKLHWGVGWTEIVKNLASGRLPVLGAANEWRAIERLKAIGVETMQLEAWGEEGLNPATRCSFIVTRELESCISLEAYCADWVRRPPPIRLKRTLIRRVAQMCRSLHQHGVNHRDLYICHFLLRQPWQGGEQDLHLYLIDLHRVQLRRRVPRRWLAKDLGSLWFSAMEIGLGQRDLLFFLTHYFQQPLRTLLEEKRALLKAVRQRAEALRAKGIPDE